MIISTLHRFHVQRKQTWKTPVEVYNELNKEFQFTLDPCPANPNFDGLTISWTNERVYCNPPYCDIAPWLAKFSEAAIAVYLLPARTGTQWWADYAPLAREVRFVRGRLKFDDAKQSAPEWSVILVFRRGMV